MSYLRIKELLKDRELTAKDLAGQLGISENGMSMIINGKRQPRFELLQKIADYLEVEFWELFTGSEDAVTGTLEYKGQLHQIRNRNDLEELLGKMEYV